MGRTYRNRKSMRLGCRGLSLQSIADNIALVKTLKSKGWLNENKLEPADFQTTGRGIFSKQAVDTNQPLISLPFDSLITLTTIESDLEFKTLFEKDASDNLTKKLSFQCLLAVYILYRRHHHPHDPYMKSIPASFSNPFFCTKQELLLLPEHIFQRVLEQSHQIKDTLSLLSVAIGGKSCSCCSMQYIPEIFSTDALKWAFFSVNSRSVFIDPTNVKNLCKTKHFLGFLRDQPNMALAPFLDLFNHSDKVNASVPEFYIASGKKDTSELVYTLGTSVPFRPYDQIFISYGILDNTRLLIEYGFILQHNTHDCVRFDMADVAAFLEANARDRKPINSNKFRFIKENQLDVEMFVCRADGLSHNLTVVLTILFVDVAHFNNVLNIVGFGDVQPLAPIADVARNILSHKRCRLDAIRVALSGLDGDHRSASGLVVDQYLTESISVIDDVLVTFLTK